MSDNLARNGFAIIEPIAIELRPLTRNVTIYTGKELAEPLPPIDFAVQYLGLAPGAPTLIAGYGGSGKTMLAQYILLCVASGRALFGLYSVGQGAVLHLDFEQGRRTTQERDQRLARTEGVDLESLGDQLNVIADLGFTLEAPDAFERLVELCKGKKLVLVDCLRACAPTLRENDSEVRQTLDLLGRVSERTGAIMLVIHHARKGNDDDSDSKFSIRGSSAIYDACSSVFVLSGGKDQPTKVTHWKDRLRGQPTPDFWFRIVRESHEGDDYGLCIEHLDSEQLERGPSNAEPSAHEKDRVLEPLKHGPFVGSRADLRATVRMGTPRFNVALSALLRTGEIIQGKNENGQNQFSRGDAT
jgi:hypothetical protein